MTRILNGFLSVLGVGLLIAVLNGCGGVARSATPNSFPLAVTVSGSGTVTSNPAGVNCGPTCTANFPNGASVTLSAVPANGFTFTGWGGDCSGAGACTVVMGVNHAVTATFQQNAPPPPPQVQLQVTATGSGTVTSSPAGINCGSACSASFNTGTAVTLTAAPASGFNFTGWGGACSGTSTTCSLTLNGNQQVTATFAAQQAAPAQLQVSVTGTGTVVSSPAGINCPQTCTANFPAGTQVLLSADAPEDGTFVFSGWGGACSGNTACKLTMDSNQSVTATFIQAPQLQVGVTGSGTVTSSPAGINCGATCSAPFPTGTSVTLTAAPAQGWTVGSWTGACTGSSATCTVSMNGNQSANVTFVTAQPQLHVTLAGAGSGVVTSNPAGINCGNTCTAPFAPGTAVTLTAAPDSTSTFSGWSGACTGTGTCSVTMNADTSVTATFAANNGGSGDIKAVNHIIFMVKENRGFDHYFGHLDPYRVKAFGLPANQVDGTPALASNPCHSATSSTTANCGWDGTSTIAANASGTSTTISPFHLATMCVENPSPSWVESHVDWNINYTSTTPAMNGFVVEGAGDAINDGFHDVYGRRVMGYYNENDLNYYYWMATQFATSDRWFSPVMTRTHPNRMYLFAATSEGHAYPIGGGNHQMNSRLDVPTIFSKLQAAGVSWKIYVPASGYTYYEMFTESDSLLNGHRFTYQDYLNDVQNGTLPQVALIDDDPAYDEHPGTDPNNPGQDVQYGAKNTEDKFINPLMQSSSWKDSVFILTYDEAGGFYDHVPPFKESNPDGINPGDIPSGSICDPGTPSKWNTANCEFNVSGFRVPLIVISPFTRPHYVSHTNMDSTAILRFIEARFGLAPLTARDAQQPDMTEFFDFANAPWATPPTPPEQNTGGACYFNQFP